MRGNDVVTAVRRTAAIQLVVALVALAALGAAIVLAADARNDAARDSCALIVGLARAAAGSNPKALVQANAYIARTQLRDCGLYAAHVAPTIP